MFDDEKHPWINIFARNIKDVISVFEFYRFMEVFCHQTSLLKDELGFRHVRKVFFYLICIDLHCHFLIFFKKSNLMVWSLNHTTPFAVLQPAAIWNLNHWTANQSKSLRLGVTHCSTGTSLCVKPIIFAEAI